MLLKFILKLIILEGILYLCFGLKQI
ncbi:hypothetical protein Goarm_017330 [Gossypium armourianum]|uniref:Uncharacterized protein n=1 Tax=Gossypium armourianum TaxID=34283 RepID=A0A7J9JEZ8_9ROSI|nr:hypothetical protein [Gossypium armourianum]